MTATLEQEPQTAETLRGPQIGRAELEHERPERANDGGGHAGGGGTPPPPPARRRGYGGGRIPWVWIAQIVLYSLLLGFLLGIPLGRIFERREGASS